MSTQSVWTGRLECWKLFTKCHPYVAPYSNRGGKKVRLCFLVVCTLLRALYMAIAAYPSFYNCGNNLKNRKALHSPICALIPVISKEHDLLSPLDTD